MANKQPILGIRQEKFSHLKRGVWHAELVGIVRAYPRTQEIYDRLATAKRANIAKQRELGKWKHDGVSPGTGRYANKRKRAIWKAERQAKIASRTVALKQAPEEVKKLMAENHIDAAAITDAEKGNAVMTFAMGVVIDEGQSMRDRLAAAKLVAEFCKQKPQTKAEVAIKNAEDFLTSLLPQDR